MAMLKLVKSYLSCRNSRVKYCNYIFTSAVLRWEGAIAPNLGFAPKCDMKHCLTNWKHQHIDAKRSVLWPSKYAKMHFRPGLRFPDLQVGWEGIPLSIPHLTRCLRRLDFQGQCFPNILLLNRACLNTCLCCNTTKYWRWGQIFYSLQSVDLPYIANDRNTLILVQICKFMNVVPKTSAMKISVVNTLSYYWKRCYLGVSCGLKMSKHQCRSSFFWAEILVNSWMPVQQIVNYMLRDFTKTKRLTVLKTLKEAHWATITLKLWCFGLVNWNPQFGGLMI